MNRSIHFEGITVKVKYRVDGSVSLDITEGINKGLVYFLP